MAMETPPGSRLGLPLPRPIGRMMMRSTGWSCSAATGRITGHRWTGTNGSFALSALFLTRLVENRNGTARLTKKGRGLAGSAVRII